MQSFSQYFETFWCYTKFSFQYTWNDAQESLKTLQNISLVPNISAKMQKPLLKTEIKPCSALFWKLELVLNILWMIVDLDLTLALTFFCELF